MRQENFKKTSEGRLLKFESENKVYCESPQCRGHGVVFYSPRTDRILCNNCKHWIYKNPQTKLKYEMKERGIIK